MTARRLVFYPPISPDGKYVAYSASTGATPSPQLIFICSLNPMVTNALPGTEGAGELSWSPDSRHIAFGTTSALKRVGLAGGAPQIICNRHATDIAWNLDDVILFSPGPDQPLLRVAAAGGEPRSATQLNQSRQEINHLSPQFLPDGRHFIYLAVSAKP
jgi:Tol biopolymer transport system component